MNGAQSNTERLDELLVKRAVESLDAGEALELEALLAEADDVDPWVYERAAAAFSIAAVDSGEPMPADVARRVQDQLSRWAAEEEGSSSNVVPLQSVEATRSEREPAEPSRSEPATGRRGRIGTTERWPWLATAAALILAIIGWWPQGPQSTSDPSEPQNLAEARDQLLEEASDAVKVEWSATDHPRAGGVSGYVVWSEQRQKGYMTFEGIPDNDPSENQYQLWVFDEQRPDEYPVDGGVFNAPQNGDGEVVVPIETKLPVKDAEMFAVTMEPPGGVVVSDRDPLLWLAKRKDGDGTSDKSNDNDGSDGGQEQDGI